VKLTVPGGEFGLTVAVQVVDPEVPLVGLHVSNVVVAVTAETVSDPELVACPASPPYEPVMVLEPAADGV
jgi:hypothetical protein